MTSLTLRVSRRGSFRVLASEVAPRDNGDNSVARRNEDATDVVIDHGLDTARSMVSSGATVTTSLVVS
jgi:hypothetical protein